MTTEPITFSDLITDKDGDASKLAFMTLAKELIADGRRPDRVFRAMLRAAYATSIEHSMEEHYDFVRYATADLADWKEQFEAKIDEWSAEVERKATL